MHEIKLFLYVYKYVMLFDSMLKECIKFCFQKIILHKKICVDIKRFCKKCNNVLNNFVIRIM